MTRTTHWKPGARWLAAALLLAGVVVGCDGGGTDPAGGPQVRLDTIGDTIRVHTISGSVWGEPVQLLETVRIGAVDGADEEIFGEVNGLAGAPDGGVYVFDQQVPALRRYGPDGGFVATLGRSGGGPGEYANSDGGMAVLPDGRLVLRDPGNARFTVYGADDAYDSEWIGRGRHFTSQRLGVDTAGNTYSVVTEPVAEGEKGWPSAMWVTRILRVSPDGTPLDTLDIPRYAFEQPELRAQGDAGSMASAVPYAGSFHWTVHPSGGVVAAVGSRYAVDLHRPDGRIVRMVRNPQAVPVSAEEKAAIEQRTTEGMRRMQPDWRWNATPIPDAKAPIENLSVGTDGRIWVKVATASIEQPPPEGADTTADRRPVFRSPPAWDVFEADGRYAGRVEGPPELLSYPEPVFAADHVWAITRDAMDVSYVTKYRLARPDSTS